MPNKTLEELLYEFMATAIDIAENLDDVDLKEKDKEKLTSQAISQIKDLLRERMEKEKLPVDRGNITKQQAYNQAISDVLKIVEEL